MPYRTPRSSERLSIRFYLLGHPLAVCVAVGAAVAGFLFLIEVIAISESALGEWLPSRLIPVWAAVYFAGGCLALIGMFTGRPNIEAPGLVLLGSAILAIAIAVFSVHGLNPGLVAGSIVGPSAIGALARAVVLTFVEPRIGAR